MRPAHLLVLVATTLATAALTAPAAFAQNVEALGEEHAGGQEEVHHCATIAINAHIVTGGCPLHFNTEGIGWLFRQHLPDLTEPVITVCNMELTARIGEDGLGYLTNPIISGSSCGITPCDEAAPSHATIPWPTGLFEVAPNEEVLVFTFCIRALTTAEGAQGVPCTLVMDANPQPDHTLELRANDVPCAEGTGVEFTGHWVAEGQGVETIHPDDIE
jgi:hypothetical protein